MDNMKHRRLQELDRSDFEIVDGEPDIRGWDVKNSQGKKIGEVAELIVDAQRKKVRYMVVELDDDELDLEDDRKVLVPIGLAELHKEDDDVILPNIQNTQLISLPKYDRDQLNSTIERQICSVLGRSGDTMATTETQQEDAGFYNHEHFNDDNLYKHRLHELKSQNKESDYERGLRLWEKRSEGGIVTDNENRRSTITGSESSREGNYREREIEEEARMEMVKNRRNSYEQRRNREDRNPNEDADRTYRRDNTIEGRIRDEGLRDA